ncbi:MAG TPA: geranylgeranyl reductase family protein [Actinomycetota bacterium]|nr:geranylgeranyl reductase family protein [Actinomycetota bacterium]
MPSPTNEQLDVDALIVGAGPGGSTAAYHLARHGMNVLMVEKASFPREKVCGDGLTPRAAVQLRRLGIDVDDPRFERHRGLRIYSRRVTLELPWPDLEDFPGFGLVMTRSEFDELLARHAEKAGARLMEQTEALAPIQDDGWVSGATIRRGEDGPETAVRARFVIAADGAASRFASQVGVRRDAAKPLGIAARRYYRIDRHPGPWLEVWMDLWERDTILPGYGWLFPLADGSVNLGAGVLNTFRDFKDVSAQRVFDAFWRMLPAEWNVNEGSAEGRVLSGPLPMGFSRTPAAVPGMLVVGDAAGMVNPFNGEGIAYAMEAGEIAAELIHDALVSDRPGIAHLYPTILRERYARYYRIGTNFVRAIGHPPVMRALTDYALPQEWLMRFMLRLMGNLTDGRKGDGRDKLMYVLERMMPVSR